MKEILHTERRCEGLSLTYTLLHHRHEGEWLYGIRIREESGGRAKEIFLDALTGRRGEAERFFTLFSDGLVTVSGAEDVLYEIQYS